jgi:hypothetical protein
MSQAVTSLLIVRAIHPLSSTQSCAAANKLFHNKLKDASNQSCCIRHRKADAHGCIHANMTAAARITYKAQTLVFPSDQEKCFLLTSPFIEPVPYLELVKVGAGKAEKLCSCHEIFCKSRKIQGNS